MFGTNAISKPMHNPNGDLLVNSVFYTIQGEGPDAGRPAIFVRLAKCNLRCYFCDTEFEKSYDYSLNSLLSRIYDLSHQHKCKFVVLTGGEPLLQNVAPLILGLNEAQISVSVETAGTICPEGMDGLFASKREYSPCRNLIVISPKTPKLNPYVARMAGAFKYIINTGEVDFKDGLPVASTQTQGAPSRLFRPGDDQLGIGVPIYVQPMDTGNENKTLMNLMLAATIAMEYGYRLSVQVHKLAQLQ